MGGGGGSGRWCAFGPRSLARTVCPGRRWRRSFCCVTTLFVVAYVALFLCVLLAVSKLDLDSARVRQASAGLRNYLAGDLVDFSTADNVTGFAAPVVPNLVHYIKFGGGNRLDFIEMLSILSAHRNHRPDRILVHCSGCGPDRQLSGPHWSALSGKWGVRVEVVTAEQPTHIFGKRLSSVYHASDVARILILQRYGGIFLDSDVYVVRSLERFRHYECALGWPPGENMGSQVLVAHRNARFLKLWLNSYRWYRPFMWYYNAGQLPTEGILMKQPGLVHRVSTHFGVHYLVDELYKRKKWADWRQYYTIHLLSRHRSYLDQTSAVQDFDEHNVKRYPFAFGQMARLLLYNTTDIIND